MLSLLRVVVLVLLSQAFIFIVLFNIGTWSSSVNELYLKDKTNALVKDPQFLNTKAEISPVDLSREFKMSVNPFKLLDAYPKVPLEMVKSKYDKVHMAIKNEDDYCERVDMYNLMNPANMFEAKNFFTDFPVKTIVREKVMPQIGNVLMEEVALPMSKEQSTKPTYPLDITINNFYVNSNGFYKYHEIGKNYLCATQMFNHILGHKSMIKTNDILNSVDQYAKFYTDKPQCFNHGMIFPQTFRLHIEEECIQFFEMIQLEDYFESLEKDPVQYLLELEYTAHNVSEGLYVLDDASVDMVNYFYDYGRLCGQTNDSITVQKYLTNPLVLNNNTKFDFILYMFIASTNPMIAYYHDGYLRVYLNESDSLTADESNKGKLWDFAHLEEYLLETGKVDDKNWLDNYLRPTIKKALVHIVRATSYAFWKQSNIHELYSMNFMLDEDLNLWFFETNPNPLLDGVKPKLIERMLLNMFEIQYAYYHSRMKRVLDVIYRMQAELEEDTDADLRKWKNNYQEAVKNRIEPEYQISEGNTWSLFIDQNLLPSGDAYFGYLNDGCLHPEIDTLK